MVNAVAHCVFSWDFAVMFSISFGNNGVYDGVVYWDLFSVVGVVMHSYRGLTSCRGLYPLAENGYHENTCRHPVLYGRVLTMGGGRLCLLLQCMTVICLADPPLSVRQRIIISKQVETTRCMRKVGTTGKCSLVTVCFHYRLLRAQSASLTDSLDALMID